MNLATQAITMQFLLKKGRMGKLSYADEKLYLEGMVDILDSISEIHGGLVYEMFKLRECIETSLEEMEEIDGNHTIENDA